MNPWETDDVLLVESAVRFTLIELSRVCETSAEHIVELVDEGVLTPHGDSPEQWSFRGGDLRRARTAVRLVRDLQLNAPGAALVLDLLDEIETLKSRLHSVSR
jgi:chaperone modulatory protein CbpM